MQSTIRDLAQKLDDQPGLRQAFFLVAALVSNVLIGYHFGALDHAVHIPFLKATAFPGLYPGDPFITLRTDQYSYFWFLFLPFLKWGILEPAMFVVHLLGTFLFFCVIWNLSITLFANPVAALFATLAFIVPHTGFVGFPVIEFSLQSRTFVLPFLIFAIINYLRNRSGVAFLILGLMYNFNLLMTNFVLAILIFDSLIALRKNGWQKITQNLGILLIGALPVLIWKIRSGNGLDLRLRYEWFSAISDGGLFQIHHILSNTSFMLLTLGGASCIALFYISQKRGHYIEHDRSVKNFMIALIGILIFQIITSIWLPITFIIQLQISRISIFILIFTYIYFSSILAKYLESSKSIDGNFVLVAGSFIFSLSPFIPLLTWICTQMKVPLMRINKSIAFLFLSLMAIGYVAASISLKLWQPGIHIFSQPSPWVDVQNWAREYTTADSIFITPPQEVGLYQPDWRVFSERGTIASLYDIFEIALKPDYYETWKTRFESIAPNAQDQFQGNYFQNQEITHAAFNGLKKDQIMDIAERYSASYLVNEKEICHDLPVAYENEQYKVFKIN